MVRAIRTAEKALGQVSFDITEGETESRRWRRSLFVTEDVKQGDIFTEKNVRSIRPADGLPPKVLPDMIGQKAAVAITRGTPLSGEMIGSQG